MWVSWQLIFCIVLQIMFEIEKYFEQYGEVEKVRFRSNMKGYEYYFVQFKNTQSATAALSKRKHRIGKCVVTVKVADSWHQPDSEDYNDSSDEDCDYYDSYDSDDSD